MANLLKTLWYEVCRGHIMAGMTLGFSLRWEGGRHIPQRGPALLVANHESFLDPPAIGLTTTRQLCYLARKTLFTPSFGWFLRSVNCVPVDQEGIAKEGLKTILELLGKGRAVLVFPEGERTRDGAMLPLKPGIQLLIKRAQAPIIPVGIAGAFDAYPRDQLLPTPAMPTGMIGACARLISS
jgi:1-acyl-sn-glycerol-3-phosphate acyltransferase